MRKQPSRFVQDLEEDLEGETVEVEVEAVIQRLPF